MVPIPKKLKDLCTPAALYFILSMLGLLVVIIQNLGNVNNFSLGSIKSKVPNTTLIFVLKFIYILFWTYILNLLCKNGYSGISWFIILIPFILFFILIGLFMLSN
jgi:hypothetical protein